MPSQQDEEACCRGDGGDVCVCGDGRERARRTELAGHFKQLALAMGLHHPQSTMLRANSKQVILEEVGGNLKQTGGLCAAIRFDIRVDTII